MITTARVFTARHLQSLLLQSAWLCLALLVFLIPISGSAQIAVTSPNAELSKSLRQGLNLPFIANNGQVDPSVSFYVQTFAGTVFITQTGEMVYSLPPLKSGKRGWTLVERFDQGTPKLAGVDLSHTEVNYIQNRDGNAETQRAEAFEGVSLGEVYPGVSVELRARGQTFEKIYTVAPGAKTESIRMSVDGAKELTVDKKGNLVAITGNGPVEFSAPLAWQIKNGRKEAVKVGYIVQANRYGYELANYDRTLPVIIDPLVQATYLGGNGTETAVGIAVHPQSGEIYLLGQIQHPGKGFTNTFPGTTGGWQSEMVSSNAYFLARMSADLKTLINATFVDIPYAVLDYMQIHPTTGDIYILGVSSRVDFKLPNISATSPPANGQPFLIKFSSDLTKIIKSTSLTTGWQYGEVNKLRLAKLVFHPVNGDIYIVSTTFNTNPTYANVLRVAADLTSYLVEKRIGGSHANTGRGIAIHPISGDVYITGKTNFTDFPSTSGGFQPQNNSIPATGIQPDAFIAQLSEDLNTIKQATYIGGTLGDEGYDLQFDLTAGDIYILGQTFSPDFPKMNGGAFTIGGIGEKFFISRISGDLRTLKQSTIEGDAIFQYFYDDRLYIHPATGNVIIFKERPHPIHARIFSPDLTHASDFFSLLTDEFGDGLIRNDLKRIPPAMNSQSGEIYLFGNQPFIGLTLHSKLPTENGFQISSQTDFGGQPDVFVAQYKLTETNNNVSSVVLQPTELVFGNVSIGNSATLPITISNTGKGTLQIGTISDPDGAFSKVGDGCTNMTIAAGGECTLQYKFAPVTLGSITGAANVNSNDPANGKFGIALSGTGVDGAQGGVQVISRTEVGAGAQLTLNGQGFTSRKGKVIVGRKTGLVTRWSDSAIVFKLPALKAGAYPVKVITKSKVTFKTSTINVHLPEIESLNSFSGTSGDTITIRGKYFGAAKPKVFLKSGNKQKASKILKGYSDTSINFKIPKRTKSGTYQVVITNSAGSSVSNVNFMVQ